MLLCSASAGAPPQRVLIVDSQLRVDPEKRRSWWSYLVSAHTRHRCDAVLVVVTPNAAVAAWAAKPIALGHPGVALHPIVLGPSSVPVIRDAAEATRCPELAVLSAMIHGRGAAAEDIARATFAAMRDLDEERAALYNVERARGRGVSRRSRAGARMHRRGLARCVDCTRGQRDGRG